MVRVVMVEGVVRCGEGCGDGVIEGDGDGVLVMGR